ncbi:MAG: hypothetical protein JSS76_20115, partial [Bacteroidetes bacterium]|nr:hypothetical protein [Bacteroidota bacterium]
MKASSTFRSLLLAFGLLLIHHTASWAQQYQFTSNGRDGNDTVTTTRIINSYAKVRAINGNVVYTNGPYVPQTRDRVLLIQMTGADSGVWQWDTVRIGGNPCYLSNIYKPFDTATGAKIQIIKAPQYQSLYIRSTGMLTAQPWNDSTGGILTFMVKDTFKIDSMGRCDVSYMGFKPKADPTPPGVNGLGGAGGAGGAIGQNGGDSALVIGSGVGGGGDGGMFGQYGTPGDTVVYALCPGCATAIYRDTARNLSLIDSGLGKNKFMMGGAGRTGHGGRGGRGGGGGGGGTAGPGTNGGAGGDGGRGGAGGRGGGIILFSSGYMQLPTGTVVFIAAGENGSDGMPGDTGQAGGNGGPGLGPCLSGGPGGGGRGAAGGNGGDGGGGGSGGTVYAVLFHHASTYTNASSSTPGGVRGNGGRGGPGGHGGQNGTTPGGGNCSGAIAGYGPDGDDGNDGNNGNNGTGSGGSGGGTGIAVIQPCQGSSGFYQNIEVGYGCSTQGYLPYFEGAAVGTPPFGYYSEDTFSSDYYTNYSILVIDASGCARYTAGEVSQPIYTPLYDITPSCPGMSNGSIQTTIDLSGGITAPPACVQPEAHSAIYDINGNFLDSTYAYFLSPGYYSVVWWINNDPMHYDTLEIEDVQPVTIMETLTQPTCDQPDGGSIELQQTSGGNICVWNTYHWSNQANGLYNDNLTAGTYDVTVGYDGPSICNFVSNVYYSTNYQCAQTFSYTLDPPVGSADVYLDVDVCAGTPYNYNGIDYYAGLNVIPPVNPGGCDTTVYLTVNEYYSNQGYEHQQVCDGDQVYWNGAYYNQTGQYYATLYGADMHGCDSTAELDLLVLPPITAGNLADQTTGDGCSFQPDFAAMNIGGGDYNLTIGTSYSWSQCVGNVLQVENTVDVYDGSSCSAEFFVNVNYVDDQYMLSIDNVTPETCPGAGDGSVSYTVTNLDNQQCNPSGFELYYGTSSTVYNVNVSGPSYTSTDYNLPAGSYTYYIDGLGQCASPVNGSFTIGSGTGGSNGTEYDTICDGGTFVWSADGATYTQTGIYQHTITGGSATGCDSTANLHLVVLAPITAGNLADQMTGDGCANGPDYTAMNISGGDGSYSYVPYAGPASCFFSALVTPYQVDVTDGHGCTAEFDLYVQYQQDNYSVSIDNTTPENCLNASDGTVSYTVFNIDNAQCNNFYVYLDFNGPNGYSQSVSVLPYQVSYTDYSLPAGTYYYNVSGGGVCSSVVQGTFTIGTSTAGVAGSEYDTICDNSTILWNGTTYAQAGTYTYTVTGGSAGGCDSTATLYLVVAPTYASDWYDTIYTGQSVTLGGQQYSAAGTYTATLTAGTGCDSTVTLYLTVLQSASPVTTYLTESICAGSSYNVGVHSYTSAGSYTDTLIAAAGQDSIIYLTLSVTQPVTGAATASICSGSSYSWGGSSYSNAGTYSHTFTAVTG